MTVQIWPELPPSCTTWRSHIEAYFIFVEGILSGIESVIVYTCIRITSDVHFNRFLVDLKLKLSESNSI